MDATGFLGVLLLCGVFVSARAAPQSFKLGAGEVGASFGGYSASAGLGGLLGGRGAAAGGLHAEAGTPGGPAAAAGLGGLLSGGGVGGGKLYSGATTGGGGPAAAAGLGGVLAGGGGGGGNLYSGASSGASSGAGSYAGGYGGGSKFVSGGVYKGGFFDRIFDIPISTLNSVNRLLNEGGGPGVSKAQSSSSSRTKVRGHHGNYHAVTKVKSKTKQFAGAHPAVYAPQYSAQGGAFASSSASSSAAGGVAAGGVAAGGNYDRIFDIPISVLEAVNRLLNGKRR